MPAQNTIDVLVKLTDEVSRNAQQIKKSIQDTSQSFSDLSNIVGIAANALTAYAGTKMLGSFISATMESNLALKQARFYANALGTEMGAQMMPKIISVGKQMQNLYGISDELGSVSFARLISKFQDEGKALKMLNPLVALHKLNLWDLDSSTKMMMNSTEDMRRALVWMARALGLDVNEAMTDTMELADMLNKRLKGINLTGLSAQISIFKEKWGDIKEKVGEPFLIAVNLILGGVNLLLDKFPSLSSVIAGAVSVIAGALGGLGFAGVLAKLIPIIASALGLTVTLSAAFVGAGLIIGGAIAAIIFSIGMVIDAMKKSGYEITFGGFKRFIEDIFRYALPEIFRESWTFIRTILVNSWNVIRDSANTIWEGIKKYFNTTIDFIVKLFQQMPYSIGFAIGALYGIIVNGFNAINTFVVTTIPSIIGTIVFWFLSLPGKVLNALGMLRGTLSNWVSEMIAWVNSTVPGIVNAIINWFEQIPGRVWNIISGIPGRIEDALTGVKNWLERGVQGAKEGAKSVLGSKAEGGIINQTGPYLLHQGEYVVPRSGALVGAGANGMQIVITGNTFMSDEDAAVKIGDMIMKVLKRNVKI